MMGLPVMGAMGRLPENKAKALARASPALGTPAPEPPVLKLANLPKTHLLAPEFGKATPGPRIPDASSSLTREGGTYTHATRLPGL